MSIQLFCLAILSFFADSPKMLTEPRFGLQVSFCEPFEVPIHLFSFADSPKILQSFVLSLVEKMGLFGLLLFLVSEEKNAGLGGAKIQISLCFSES